MSDQPTSIAAMTTSPFRAALSITAWSIEIARWIDSYARSSICGEATIGPSDWSKAGVPAERGRDRPATPQEHPGVPGDAAALFDQLLRARRLWLLLEPLERVGREAADDLAARRDRG